MFEPGQPTILCRFQLPGQSPRVGAVLDDRTLLDLTALGIAQMTPLLEADDPAQAVADRVRPDRLDTHRLDQVRLLSPVEGQEVWAAGVTYLRSKQARMEESDFGATAYDRVYAAPRPELFFKSLPAKVAGPEEAIGMRSDSHWSVPEPELGLVLNSRGRVAGYTVGNDVSARDIEGDNLLYLPQAKIYNRSCALGPWVRVGVDEATARTWAVTLQIERDGRLAFEGETRIDRIRRGFDELAAWLFRSQTFPGGAVLLTGTGIVPPDDFTLQADDQVAITISGIGRLGNRVVRV